MKNTGKEYENFVAQLQQALLNAENVTEQKNIEVELNKKIEDNCGVQRQFDIYWEYELGGITYKTVIECKDYDSLISVEKIDALIGKLKDIPDLKPVFATRKGYQSGAEKKAKNNKIDLLVVREQNSSDWEDEDGNPFIREVHLKSKMCMPAHIQSFEPMIDEAWVKENTSIDTSQPFSFSALNSEIIIEDIGSGETYSLYDLGSKLRPCREAEYGTFEKIENLDDAYICINDVKLKLKGYKLKYLISKPIESEMVIDFSKELLGVIEYLQKGKKVSVFKNGVIR